MASPPLRKRLLARVCELVVHRRGPVPYGPATMWHPMVLITANGIQAD
ncbi:hypothetical protein V1460_14365 [Streptomyces sp. SCSIO 30461]